MTRLRSFERGLYRAERAAVCALLGLLAALAFVQVLLRQFSYGLVWAETVLRHLVLWTGFLAAAAAAHDERHFAVDALARLLPAPMLVGLARLGRAVGAAASAALAWASWRFLVWEWKAGDELFAIAGHSFQSAPFLTVLPLSFALMAFHFAMRLGEPPVRSHEG